MKKLLPLLLLSAFLFLPQSAYAGLSEGCFPIVECDVGEDYYGLSCQPHIEVLSDCGVPLPSKFNVFSCSAGCYEKSVSVPSQPPTCPGGIDFSGNCLIKLDILDDDVDVDGVSNPAFKIWDGANLTEMVHLGTAGCTDDQLAVSDASELTGWKCEDKVVLTTPLSDYVDGVVNFLDTLMTELGVDNTVKNNIVNALSALSDGATPAELATLAAAFAAFSIPPTDVIWAGVTSTSHDGKYTNGYADADALCASNYASSRVCSVEEIMTLRHLGDLPGSVGGDEKAWINGGPPGFNSAANDCAGWKINDTTANNAWGRYWWFGLDQGWADGCNLTHRFACCK